MRLGESKSSGVDASISSESPVVESRTRSSRADAPIFSVADCIVIHPFSVVIFITPPIYMKDLPNSRVGRIREEEEMESEGMAVPNLINGYKPIQLGQLNIQARYPRQLVIFGPLRWTSFLKYLANGTTQDMCQHLMLTGIDTGLLDFDLESFTRCRFLIAVCTFCPELSNEATGGGRVKSLES